MKYITLGSRNVPAIGLGTYKITGPDAIDTIRKALLIGYRHIDTAQLYDNEREVGAAIVASSIPRNEIFLTTKVWPSNLTEDKFLHSVEESLEKLKTDYVDLLLIHWPHHQMHVQEYITTFMKIQELGLTKEIGVSNFNIAQLRDALKEGARIVTNQVEFHPWINQVKLYEFMLKHQIALTAYTPLGQGKFMSDKKLEALAANYVRTPAQIVLRWMMQKEDIIAIPKSKNLHRLRENLNVFDFELSNEDMEIINAWRLENIRVVGAQNGAVWD
jgi:2,5-diketo-D-gluconate reductase B